MTPQEVFNTAVSGVLEQGALSKVRVKTGPSCLYRHPDGYKCAVGQLLTDGEASKADKSGDVYMLHKHGLLPARLVPHLSLLGEIQGAHDEAKDLNDFERRAEQVANEFDLEMPTS